MTCKQRGRPFPSARDLHRPSWTTQRTLERTHSMPNQTTRAPRYRLHQKSATPPPVQIMARASWSPANSVSKFSQGVGAACFLRGANSGARKKWWNRQEPRGTQRNWSSSCRNPANGSRRSGWTSTDSGCRSAKRKPPRGLQDSLGVLGLFFLSISNSCYSLVYLWSFFWFFSWLDAFPFNLRRY